MYKLSKRSLNNLEKVHPILVELIKEGIKVTPTDFGVTEGLRTMERQHEYVEKGVSWTLDSKHLMQSDGYAHAVDIVALVDGKACWQMGVYAGIAAAFKQVADELGDHIIWGGVWDTVLKDLPVDNFEDRVDEYVERFRAKYGRNPHLDGPHFQLAE